MRILFLLIIISYALTLQSASDRVLKTKDQLKYLNTKIQQLQSRLASAHNTRGALTQKLARTERELNQGIKKLQRIQNDYLDQQKKINALEKTRQTLAQSIEREQALLAHHISLYYKKQLKKGGAHRSVILNRYLMQSHAQLLHAIAQNEHSLSKTADHLKKYAKENQRIQQTINQHQQELEEHKQKHAQTIAKLSTDIKKEELTLKAYERNKKNLSDLLTKLSSHSALTHTKGIFSDRYHPLAPPIHPFKNYQLMRQGISFFAPEGTAIYAAYPGSIVFSDWLNGYGLLLIIDHGHGLMTLYANNKALLKHKGEHVDQGDVIAKMGHTGDFKQNALYFEVRQRGIASPPLKWIKWH